MKKIALMVLCLGFIGYCSAQTITIIAEKTGEPLEFVSLSSQNPRAIATTDAEGKADISAFEGAEKIEIRLFGYETLVKSFAELKDAGFSLTLTPTQFSLDQVVVSANRWNQRRGDVPARISSISSREVNLQNPQTAADLLSVSGEVFIQKSQQGGGSPMIRGFATNRLLYAVDGVRMNTAIFRGGNIQNVINLDPFAIENTEVLFGPGSVIYGSDAIGGVMSFHTLKPKFSLTDTPLVNGKAIARYSSANDEKTGHIDVNVGWEKWSLVSSISHWNYGHLRQGRHGPADYLKPFYVERRNGEDQIVAQEDPLLQIPSAYSQLNLMQKVRFKPSSNWDLEYGFHFSETSSYGRYDRHNRMRNGGPRYGEWDYGPQKWMMNNLSISHSTAGRFYDKMTLRLAWQSFEESRISRDFNAVEREVRTEQVEAYSANLDFVKSTGSTNSIYYGFEYVLDDVTSIGINENIETGEEEPGPARYPQAAWASIGLYLNDVYKLSDQFTLQAGLRYNRFILNAEFDTTFYPFPFTEANINNGALTGSIGGVYRPAESWALSANFATAFRSPNVDDVGKVFDSEPGAVTVPNPDLEAEFAYNLDLGIAKTFGNVLKLDFTGFYSQLSNALVRRNFTLNGREQIMYDGELSRVQAIQNAARADVYGFQAGMEWQFGENFSLTSNFNYQLGEEELEDGSTSPSRHAAPFFGVTRLKYSNNKLSMELNAVYQGERKHEDLSVEERDKEEIYALDENGNTYAPAWYTINWKAMYRINPSLSVNAGVENITDQRYRPYSSGISGAGRNFVLSLQAGF